MIKHKSIPIYPWTLTSELWLLVISIRLMVSIKPTVCSYVCLYVCLYVCPAVCLIVCLLTLKDVQVQIELERKISIWYFSACTRMSLCTLMSESCDVMFLTDCLSSSSLDSPAVMTVSLCFICLSAISVRRDMLRKGSTMYDDL